MMVETILESSQDFGMSSGALPQWKRELLQRRAARARPAPPPPPPPPPPPAHHPHAAEPDDADEELRYGPGIVKRLKSRYLSLALRDAPRRRPSVLRRATSLEHLLDPRPPPAPRPPSARTARPASLAAPPAAHAYPAPTHRRDLVKRARSVDALSRLEPRDEPPSPPPPSPPPPPPRAAAPRAARPPRRPAPLLRDAERPPPDLVRSTLRKFEPTAARRPVPAARVSAAMRTLELTSTPEARARSPSPLAAPADLSAIEEAGSPALTSPRVVSRAALEGIARAGCTTRYAFEAPRLGSHLPPLAAANPVLVGRARRVGIIRPMPAPALERALAAPLPPEEELAGKLLDEPRDEDAISRVAEEDPKNTTPPPEPAAPVEVEAASPARADRRSTPPSALVEPIPRPPLTPPPPPPGTPPRDPTPEPPAVKPEMAAKPKIISKPEYPTKPETRTKPDPSAKPEELPKKDVTKKAECVAGPDSVLRPHAVTKPKPLVNGEAGPGSPRVSGARRVGAGGGRGPPAATSVVFNFSGRKEVPDYIENDGLVLRAARRHRIKAGEPGVVVLRPELVTAGDSDEESEPDGRPPSPCNVRFVNDNVLINGRSCMPARPDRARQARLKLQFDDSLTRTFEYPSETSVCEDAAPAEAGGGQLAEPAHLAPLAHNTHIVSAALARYTPHKTSADTFQLGVTRRDPAPAPARTTDTNNHDVAVVVEEECGDARPCGADAARSWSEARTIATDLLF